MAFDDTWNGSPLQTTYLLHENKALSTTSLHGRLLYWIMQFPLQLLSVLEEPFDYPEVFGDNIGRYIKNLTSPNHLSTALHTCFTLCMVGSTLSASLLRRMARFSRWLRAWYWIIHEKLYLSNPHSYCMVIMDYPQHWHTVPSMLNHAYSLVTAFSVRRIMCLSRGIWP